ncbi:MAG: type II toxin-antitoxin system HigB family toxin [archaeon]|nr:type II toxin-antitoxin system HigB family toxin [archaeon]
MKYEAKYDPKAEKQLEKLEKEVAQRIIKKIAEVAETGRGIESIKEKQFGYKIRIGKYRALVDLEYDPNVMWVRYIDHRDRVYERV